MRIKDGRATSAPYGGMDTIEARYAERNVPRYTSYPTAPHFGPQVTGSTYAGWLAQLPEADDLSLYLHVPFCRDICHYCGCHTKASRKDAPILSYAETMIEEIRVVRRHIGGTRRVSHIHWGGGTPSLLPREAFLRIVETLRESFDIAADCEHAIELDPRYVTPALAETLAQIGVTRTSLGVQDFDPDVQRAIGRIQPVATVRAAVEALRGAGLDAINFDLMYGLPDQTLETITATVRQTLELAPSRIALFGYAHVPWMKKNQRLIDEAQLPNATERRALSDHARELLASDGFDIIGLDHFARPDDAMARAYREGELRRNFQGYTCDSADTMIGFGTSSIGRLPQGFVQNAPDVTAWHKSIEEGIPPVVRGIALDNDDRARAAIIEQLMTDYTVDVAEVAAHFSLKGSDFADAFENLIEPAQDNLVVIDGLKVSVTSLGRPYVRIVAAAFDAYLASNQARHSVAI